MSKKNKRPLDVCVAIPGFEGEEGFVNQSTRVGKMWLKADSDNGLHGTIDFDLEIPTEVVEQIIAQTKKGDIVKQRFISTSLVIFEPRSAK